MEGDFQECRNCKRSVASVHFTLHEAHCLRFLVLCSECEEPIPKGKMKEHLQDAHQQTKKSQQSPVKCKFCDIAMHFSKLDIHESHCGSRTERCPCCNQPIMLRVLAQHKDVCQSGEAWPEEGKRILSPEKKIHCDYCKQMIPENKYVRHMKKCPISKTVKYHQDGKPQIPPSSLPHQAAGNQTSAVEKDVRPKAKNRNRFPRLLESSTKQAPDGTVGLPLKSEIKPRGVPTGDETAYDILQRCSQCGILLPLPTLRQHQEKCLKLASWKGKQMRKAS
ncbi:XIAP-associated factor 1 isoform X1 [Nannospalax galili]|uniref:XIAP-associated factor 1 isoform X1 n=2 Tax=Nannospalax galili TaxID=1026970 RepID=UPI0004ED02E3|nr:XIAP-associated factor 1 isoform X1 [Nannospalax galili]XP_008853869.1 XIAP-associated factor 1 isoform X1 [Nannospalax galili]